VWCVAALAAAGQVGTGEDDVEVVSVEEVRAGAAAETPAEGDASVGGCLVFVSQTASFSMVSNTRVCTWKDVELLCVAFAAGAGGTSDRESAKSDTRTMDAGTELSGRDASKASSIATSLKYGL
jgi:hypothetical protein